LPDSFWNPARELWSDPSENNFAKIREAAMSKEALVWNYTHRVKDATRISPDSWVLKSALLKRPENKEIMLHLLYDYRTNPGLYPKWQEYFRKSQPPTLIVWGKNDAIFPASGAYPYRRDLKYINFNVLDTGHFALEEACDVIAEHIRRFSESEFAAKNRG
jgi:pimeloyl-ACP methyl ester carboxylesterase